MIEGQHGLVGKVLSPKENGWQRTWAAGGSATQARRHIMELPISARRRNKLLCNGRAGLLSSKCIRGNGHGDGDGEADGLNLLAIDLASFRRVIIFVRVSMVCLSRLPAKSPPGHLGG